MTIQCYKTVTLTNNKQYRSVDSKMDSTYNILGWKTFVIVKKNKFTYRIRW